MSLTYPIDPSLPSNPSPLFSDTSAARGDHLRGNNAEIWGNFSSLQSSKIEVISASVADAIALFDGATGKILKDSGVKIATSFVSKVDTLIATVKATSDYIDSLFPIGIIMDYAGITIPVTFWNNCNGDSLLRSSFPTCWANLSAVIGTCTISQATPGVVHIVGHGLLSGDCIAFTSTGSLPTPLGIETKYYVTRVDADNLKISTTYANYLAGAWIATTNAGSGTHTLRFNPWGIADSTHFNLPDLQGLITEGSGTQSTADWHSSNYSGRLGQYKQDQIQDHTQKLLGKTGLGTEGVSTTNYLSGQVSGGGSYMWQTTTDTINSNIIGGVLNGRSGLITDGPRAGMNKIIRVK